MRNPKWNVTRFNSYRDSAGVYRIKPNGRHHVGYVRFSEDAHEIEILRAIERLGRVRLHSRDVHFDWLGPSSFNLNDGHGKPLYQISKGFSPEEERIFGRESI